jgi:hypothetical protein
MPHPLLSAAARAAFGAAAALALAAAPALAQHAGHHPAPADSAKAQAAQAAHAAAGWKEMDAFHLLMMQTWHPASAKNDLAPARARAGALADAARSWAAAPVPKACDTPANRAALKSLDTESRAFAELAAKPATTDAALKASLKALHDRFEPLEEGCAPAAAPKDAHAGHPQR